VAAFVSEARRLSRASAAAPRAFRDAAARPADDGPRAPRCSASRSSGDSQVLTVVLAAPLLGGVIDRLEATIPFAVNETLVSATCLVSPAHWLLAAAFFLVILAEAGRLAVDNRATSFECP
jgi:hypothetical protein